MERDRSFRLPTPRIPLLVSLASGGLLLALIVRDAGPRSEPAPLRIPVDRSPRAVVRIAPDGGARVAGSLGLAWEPNEGAIAYRVVVSDPASGEVLVVDAGRESGVEVPAQTMAGTFPGGGSRELWWFVSMRRLDGEERISAPGRVVWSEGER